MTTAVPPPAPVPAPPPAKSLLASKTFWINLVGGAAQIVGLTTGLIPAPYAPIGIGVQAILNIILRLITNQPISGIVTAAVLLLCLPVFAGCSTMTNLLGPSEKFTASLSASGAVAVPPTSLGTVNVPASGASLLELVVGLAGPLLDKSYSLKACTVETYPATTASGQISVTATAACKLNGAPVVESLVVSLTPSP
jgi:hypothetical protein